jgi:hypothetical protein
MRAARSGAIHSDFVRIDIGRPGASDKRLLAALVRATPQGAGGGDFAGALMRSFALATMIMAMTVVSLAAG